MKKKYIKPQALFESFELSSSIAAGCAPNNKALHAEGSCAFIIGGKAIFTDEVNACATKVQDGGTLCYHVSADGNKIFSS